MTSVQTAPSGLPKTTSIQSTQDSLDSVHQTPSSTLPPEKKIIDVPETIPDNEEDGADANSDAVEPVTPTSDAHSHEFVHHNASSNESHPSVPSPVAAVSPTLTQTKNAPTVNTIAPTPPRSPAPKTSTETPKPLQSPRATKSWAHEAPETSKREKLKSLFRRSNSQLSSPTIANPKPSTSNNTHLGSDGAINIKRASVEKHGLFSGNFSISGGNSPKSSKSNSPPSPASPASEVAADELNPDAAELDRTRNRSSQALTHLSASVSTTANAPKIAFQRPRATTSSKKSTPKDSIYDRGPFDFDAPPLPLAVESLGISLYADEGIGLKSRRMSTALPNEIIVDVVELHKEYAPANKLKKKTIGTGATADVSLYTRKGGNPDELYAVKRFRARKPDEDPDDYVKKVKSEYTIAHALHHPNIVDHVRLCTHSGLWNSVMVYLPFELYACIQKKYMKEDDYLCLFKQLLRGIAHLHSLGVAHRDIKLENLLMNAKGELKIADFGVAEVFAGEHPGLRGSGGECGKNMGEVKLCKPGICGSPEYLPPEVIAKKEKYDPRAVDVWSAAIVCVTMHIGGQPWGRPERNAANPYYGKFLDSWEAWLKKHPDGKITDEAGGVPKLQPAALWDKIPTAALRRIVAAMLHPDPTKRVTVNEVLNDRWVKTIECCADESHDVSVGGIDACKVGSKKSIGKAVKKMHNHLPPPGSKVPKMLQHRFDMGDGYS